MTKMVDWDFAVSLAARIAGDGPDTTSTEAAAVVAELREGARRSTSLVRDYTGLVAPEDTAPVLVVDRAGWVQANADGFAQILEPIIEKLAARKGVPQGLSNVIGSRVTGAEIGFLLGFLGSKVLGQFDPFHAPDGRLLLVAPNVVHVQREISADPHDFRLWVCLHEETHRVQFTANPWLRGHLTDLMQSMADAIEPRTFLEDGSRKIAEVVRGDTSIVEILSSPEQREVLDRVTGVMSLLEGHADVVMDGVGPLVIPSVESIRASFNQRRGGVGTLDRILRRLLGLDAKMAQYREGAVFVRHVVDKVGMAEFNTVWSGPDTLPSRAEINDPDAWIARVL